MPTWAWVLIGLGALDGVFLLWVAWQAYIAPPTFDDLGRDRL